MPYPTSPEELTQKMRSLPETLRNFLASPDVLEGIEAVQQARGLTDLQTITLSRSIAWYIAGFLTATELGLEVSKIAPQDKFAEIRADIIKKIFLPFGTQLNAHGLNFKAISLPTDTVLSRINEAEKSFTENITAAPASASPPITIPHKASVANEKASPAIPSLTSSASSVPSQEPAPLIIKPIKEKEPTFLTPALQSSPRPATPPPAAPPPVIIPKLTSQHTAVSASAPNKQAVTQPPPAPTGLRVTIAPKQPGVPTTPLETAPQATPTAPMPPKPIRYTPAPIIRDVPKVISPSRPPATPTGETQDKIPSVTPPLSINPASSESQPVTRQETQVFKDAISPLGPVAINTQAESNTFNVSAKTESPTETVIDLSTFRVSANASPVSPSNSKQTTSASIQQAAQITPTQTIATPKPDHKPAPSLPPPLPPAQRTSPSNIPQAAPIAKGNLLDLKG